MIARFQIESAKASSVAEIDADWLNVMHFSKSFTTGIIGKSSTIFMSAGDEEGFRSYVATERIWGHLGDGSEGEFTIQHGGLESDPDTWFGHIVPKTGTGPFANWTGSARIVHDADGAFFEIDVDQ